MLLSAGARGLSIRNGVSIQICRRYWRRGQGKKTDRKNRVGFSVSFLGVTEKPTEKDDFRFSVHNPDDASNLRWCTIWIADTDLCACP